MKLPAPRFKVVVRDTVLVALDLLILNNRQEILVGKRRNRPAKDFFFVPGGRIQKGETLDVALARISLAEVGVRLEKEQASLYGVFHHSYPDNFFGDPGVSTEYVVIACLFQMEYLPREQPRNQHEQWQFLPVYLLTQHPYVHPYTKSYFRQDPENIFLMAHAALTPEKLATGKAMSSPLVGK